MKISGNVERKIILFCVQREFDIRQNSLGIKLVVPNATNY